MPSCWLRGLRDRGVDNSGPPRILNRVKAWLILYVKDLGVVFVFELWS